MCFVELNQIPKVSVQVLEDGYDTVVSFFRGTGKMYSQVKHFLIVALKIIRTQKEKYASTCLIPNKRFLHRL